MRVPFLTILHQHRLRFQARFATHHPASPFSLVIPFLIAIFALLVIRRAWVCDDAYITFRTIDNLFHGYRLTWNVTERVQVYTHPLWMLLLAFVSVFIKDIYAASLILSIGLAVGAVSILATRLAGSQRSAALVILVLALSKSFVDFSTSGLENSLSHFLLVLFFWLFFQPRKDLKNFFWLSFIASLAILNRMDTALIYLPALLYAFGQVRSRKAVLLLFLSQLPFILWELFSLFYYGFLFPNTAYAKLNTGLLSGDLIRQGLLYLLNVIEYDPITPLVIAAGILLAFLSFQKKTVVLAAGASLYLLYIIKIGGDFMEGRFFTLPLLCAVILLSQVDLARVSATALLVLSSLLLLVSLNVPNPTFRLNDLGPIDSGPIHIGENGILNERLLYYGGTGLLNARRNDPLPNFYWGIDGERSRNAQDPLIERLGIGLFGYYAGPEVYILDRLALADPLLARLPMRQDVNWRVGHYERLLPPGYKQTLQLGQNMLQDPDLALYYDKLSIITRGSLTSPRRLLEIWKMNTGQYDHLIHADRYQYPEMQQVQLADLSQPYPRATLCSQPGPLSLTESGIEILMPEFNQDSWLALWLDHNDQYRLYYYQADRLLARQTISTAYLPEPGGLSLRTLKVPLRVSKTGFDRLRIIPLTTPDDIFCIGSLQTIP